MTVNFKVRLLYLLALWIVAAKAEFNPLEDDLFFHINWPGPSADFLQSDLARTIDMTTVNDEKYKCILPAPHFDSQDRGGDYMGPSAFELLRPLFVKLSCIFKFEQYWMYELCHGRHLRQYHEEKEPGKPEVLQEYYLGRYSMEQFNENALSITRMHTRKRKVPVRNVEKIIMPYVVINMTDGTTCDLDGKPRMAAVMYACHPASDQEIYSIEETRSCEYEVLVLTNLLCEHPDYSLRSPATNEIHCHSVDNAPVRPIILQNLETESNMLNPYSPLFDAATRTATVTTTLPMTNKQPSTASYAQYDSKIVYDFLQGQHCLHGGTGWWKYEFCYGKQVEQYHEEMGHRKTTITLGKWNKDKHLQWLMKNPQKKPKQGLRRHISHFYDDGDFCIVAASHRRVEVKLRCKDSTEHPNAVSLYLLEPRACEYILVVESPILCSLLSRADDDGLIKDPVANVK